MKRGASDTTRHARSSTVIARAREEITMTNIDKARKRTGGRRARAVRANVMRNGHLTSTRSGKTIFRKRANSTSERLSNLSAKVKKSNVRLSRWQRNINGTLRRMALSRNNSEKI